MNRNHFLRTLLPATLGTLLSGKAMGKTPPDAKAAAHLVPKNLRPGDIIGITCPASPMEAKDAQYCIDALKLWGFKVKMGNTVGQHWQRFGGTDKERAADLQQLLDDPHVDAILFGRGGFGVMRMMDKLNWKHFARKPKWIVGYSDITALHCHINSVYGIPTLHADMATGFDMILDDAAKSIQERLTGKKIDYKIEPCIFNRNGHAKATLVGGNLSMIYAMQGSKSELHTAGKILFIEDVGEYKYTIDRMLTNLKRSGKLSKLAGLVVGGFTSMKVDKEFEYTMLLEEIILDKVAEYHYPVCFNFPAGHQKNNLALKLGMPYRLKVTNNSCSIKELQHHATAMADTPVDDLFFPPDSTSLAVNDTLRIEL